ncbi:hypothetical protein AB0I28_35495 [Phytomonospora sp. NPDC050363]|uniref:WXG100-like domain-containing protein n=1 Tax=Phytomonospora sp. NPDC050363 TaxID=3155642 RepID=UPI0033D0AFCC
MALMLPSELADLLGLLGYDWPASNEESLIEMGQAWMDLSGELDGVIAEANAAAGGVWDGNLGAEIDAFKGWWTGDDGPVSTLDNGATAALIGGAGMIICGVIVIALKIMVIVQLVILAVQIAIAVAEAAVTFGASLLQIPLFQQLARQVISNLMQEAVFKLLG